MATERRRYNSSGKEAHSRASYLSQRALFDHDQCEVLLQP